MEAVKSGEVVEYKKCSLDQKRQVVNFIRKQYGNRVSIRDIVNGVYVAVRNGRFLVGAGLVLPDPPKEVPEKYDANDFFNRRPDPNAKK